MDCDQLDVSCKLAEGLSSDSDLWTQQELLGLRLLQENVGQIKSAYLALGSVSQSEV